MCVCVADGVYKYGACMCGLCSSMCMMFVPGLCENAVWLQYVCDWRCICTLCYATDAIVL